MDSPHRNETLVGLLQFWSRLLGEFLVGVLPYAVASALFSAWIVKAPRTRQIERFDAA